MKRILAVFLLLLPGVFAAGETDAILEPLNKIYDLVMAAVPIIGVLALIYCGIRWMTAGDNIQARDSVKQMAGSIVIGLAIIMIAPALVSFFATPAA